MVHFVLSYRFSEIKGMLPSRESYAGNEKGGGIHNVYMDSQPALTKGIACFQMEWSEPSSPYFVIFGIITS